MAKGEGGSVGARRGGKVEAKMPMGKAKSFANTGSSKPNLDNLKKVENKVTNKPSMSGKRMK